MGFAIENGAFIDEAKEMIITAGQVAALVATFVERTLPHGEGGPVYGGQVRAIILAFCSITEMESDIRRPALEGFCHDD